MIHRSRLCGALLVSVCGACGSDRVEAPPPVPVNWASLDRAASPPPQAHAPTARERATAEGYVAGLASPQLANIGPLFDEMGHIAFGRKDARTRAKVVALHEQLFGAFDQRTTAATRVWRTEDTQFVEWTMSAVQARDWLNVPATQRPVAMRGIALLWTKDDGTITDAHLYFSVAAVKAQLGVGSKELQQRAAGLQQPTKGPPVEQAGSAQEQDDVQVVRDELDFLEQQKDTQYLALFTDDAEVHTLTMSPMRGKEDLRTYFRSINRAIGQLDTTIATVKGIGSFVVVEYTISGVQLGQSGLQPNSTLRLYVTDVVELRDERIASVWRYDGADLDQ